MAEKDVAAAGPENAGDSPCVALRALEALRDGLVKRQVWVEVRLPEGASSGGSPGHTSVHAPVPATEHVPELHASIPGTRRPVVVTVVGDRFRWWRGGAAPGGGGGASCPVTCPSRAVDMVIRAVNTS